MDPSSNLSGLWIAVRRSDQRRVAAELQRPERELSPRIEILAVESDLWLARQS